MKKFLPVILITALIATMFVFTNAGAASYKLGDVDLNGQVLANDARSILRYSARLESDYDELRLTLADVNGVDGEELGMTGMLTLIIREEKGLLGITTSKHMYMLNDDAKTYFEINEAAMKLIGLDMDDLDMDFDLGMLGGSAGASAVLSKETVDGVEYDVYAFNNEEQGTTTKMYMDGDKLVMFEMFDQEGELTSRYEIDKFVPYPGEGEFEVPSGYKKQSILKFFGENI